MSNEQKEIKMTQAEKITNLIEIADKLTRRCMKIEKDSIQQIWALEKRILKLENKREWSNEDEMLDDLSRPWKK
jgi:polyhydroxyalkanoate synthesis regulator phasin